MNNLISDNPQFRIAFDVTLITTGIAIVGVAITSASITNLPTIGLLGLCYGLVLAFFVDKSRRKGGLRTQMMTLFAILLFVPMFLLLVMLPSESPIWTLLVFYGIGVIPASVLELVQLK